MRDEISAAVLFLARLIEKGEKFNQDQVEHFKLHLTRLLVERCKDHWFPDNPEKGQGYRCIRVNGVFHDSIIKEAANASGMKYKDILYYLPCELTIWVDPHEVCCRFGESNGSFCTLSSFDTKMELSESNSDDSQGSVPTSPTASPPHISLQIPEYERKAADQRNSRNRARYNGRGGWSPPRPSFHGYNHYCQHWPPKSTLKV